ncbi:MAG TPA: ABC transporter substrate-binding protein, partial [Dermatophilaceae bacterium]|nr:ABC transporter substrate-binding protein [Dermatophilaceae bacterium]
QDVGSFNDDTVNQALEAAAATGDPDARTAAWAQVDQQIARLGGYIALAERRRLLMHGAGVTAYADSVLLGGWPDLAVIGVRR